MHIVSNPVTCKLYARGPRSPLRRLASISYEPCILCALWWRLGPPCGGWPLLVMNPVPCVHYGGGHVPPIEADLYYSYEPCTLCALWQSPGPPSGGWLL